jgi:hypothetical protein
MHIFNEKVLQMIKEEGYKKCPFWQNYANEEFYLS